MSINWLRVTYLSEQRDYCQTIARSQRLRDVAIEVGVVAKQLDLKLYTCIRCTSAMTNASVAHSLERK